MRFDHPLWINWRGLSMMRYPPFQLRYPFTLSVKTEQNFRAYREYWTVPVKAVDYETGTPEVESDVYSGFTKTGCN